ncbi:MAG: alpha/beta hydrolase [Roseibium sp.]
MIYLVVGICAVLFVGATYTYQRARNISALYQPDGKTAVIDGRSLHYHFFPAAEVRAEDPVLVFLHGASGNAYDSMLAFKDELLGQYSLLFLDRPGLGFSDRNLIEHRTPEGQARLIARLLEVLGIQDAIAIGHSLGAAVTADLGLVAPERVKGLVFIAPATHPWPGGVKWYYSVASWPIIGNLFCWTITLPVAERLAPRAMDNVFYPNEVPVDYAEQIRLPLLLLPDGFRANSSDIANLEKHVIRQSPNYASLEQPALVITGTEDTVVWPSIHSEALFRDLPNADLMVFDGAGHMLHHTHTREICGALERLVARVNDDTSGTSRDTQAEFV